MTTGRYRIAVLPGDGVGPEVVSGGRRVLDAAGVAFGFSIDWLELSVGGEAIDAHGAAILPADVIACRNADAVLLGAVGGPAWDDPTAAVRPEQALFVLRGGLELFANLRPVRPYSALAGTSPLRPELLEGVDLLIVRELTGGIYFGGRVEAGERSDGSGGRRATDSLPYSEVEIARLVRLGFELARARRRHVTSVDKANVLATSRLWRRVATEVAAEFRDVTLDHRLVDACAMQLVSRPADFDVIVTENLFGDILSDEASVLAGSLGMLPSASLGAGRTAHGLLGLYEPVHGSAPDIAGRDIANPIGTILSCAMLLRLSLGQVEAADAVEAAVATALDDGYRTADIWPAPGEEADRLARVGTSGMSAAIIERLVGGSVGATLSATAFVVDGGRTIATATMGSEAAVESEAAR